MAVALAVLALAAVVVAVVLSGDEEASPPQAQEERPADSPSPAGRSPDSVVRSFYTRAANDQFESAWKLAGPRARSQLGGFEGFKRQLGTLESVTSSRPLSPAGAATTPPSRSPPARSTRTRWTTAGATSRSPGPARAG